MTPTIVTGRHHPRHGFQPVTVTSTTTAGCHRSPLATTTTVITSAALTTVATPLPHPSSPPPTPETSALATTIATALTIAFIHPACSNPDCKVPSVTTITLPAAINYVVVTTFDRVTWQPQTPHNRNHLTAADIRMPTTRSSARSRRRR